MKIEVTKPHILRIAYRQEKNDQDYGSCLWAYFDFDTDEYMLNIQSDCGNAAYGWPKTPSESFLRLMARISDDYLLEKLFNTDELDVRESLKNAKAMLSYDTDLTKKDRQYKFDRLREILVQCNGYSDAVGGYCEWQRNYYPDAPTSEDIIVMDYKSDAKRIARIFSQKVQPQIRQILAEQESEKHETN